MKQALIILSVIAVAFLAACSDNAKSLALQTNGGVKSVADLQKVTEDSELSNFKKQLEANKNVEIPDIILAVKKKFGIGSKTLRSRVDNTKTFQDIRTSDTNKNAQDDSKLMKQPGFEDVETLDTANDASKVVVNKIKNQETKYICIQTCEKQVIVVRKLNDDGKVDAVHIYVTADISKSNATILTKTNKSLNSISMTYDLSSDRMLLKFDMLKDKNSMVLKTAAFALNQDPISSIVFAEVNGDETGSMDVLKASGKMIRLNFDNDKDVIKIKLLNDLGVFGRNSNNSEELEKGTQIHF